MIKNIKIMKKNLFWTGGFDSTFRLLQLLDDDLVIEINLFYISLVIDNVEYSDVRRKSIPNEINTMLQILRKIDTNKIKKFNIIGKNEDLIRYSFMFNFNFMNFIQKQHINYSDKNKIYFFDLLSLDIISRPINQWGAITQILDDLNIEAEICIEKDGGIWSKIKNYVIDGRIQFDLLPALSAFSKYQIPLFDVSREEMLKNSNDNWIRILEITWSCWYPKDNKPCGRCFTCKRRPL